MPSVVETRWNYHSRTIKSVYENKESLKNCFERIQNDETMDDHSVSEAIGLSNWLHDKNFNYLLSFFYDVLKHVDILYNIIQARHSNGLKITLALKDFETVIDDIRENTNKYFIEDLTADDENHFQFRKRSKRDDRNIELDAKEACNVIVHQMKERFKNSQVFASFTIVDPKKFSLYKDNFPEEELTEILKNYNMLSKEQMGNELKVMYKNETFRNLTGICELLAFLSDNGLVDIFPEISKLLEIIIVTPVASAESERCFSTLKRIKTFLRNSMMQERLNALATLSIHKEFIKNIPNFINKVIDAFAVQKNRRGEFLYK
jgi:hypothetical protein